jgi:hypothetical protein
MLHAMHLSLKVYESYLAFGDGCLHDFYHAEAEIIMHR